MKLRRAAAKTAGIALRRNRATVTKRTKSTLHYSQEMRYAANILEELLRRKQSYLLSAFFDEAAHPVEHACLGPLLANHIQGIKLIVKRNISWGGGDYQRWTCLRCTLKLRIRATIQRCWTVHGWNRRLQTEG